MNWITKIIKACEKIKEGSQKGLTNLNLAKFVGHYVKRLSKGVKH